MGLYTLSVQSPFCILFSHQNLMDSGWDITKEKVGNYSK
ncbi:hypothetical protein IX324_002866 [Bacteroides pyogenes]|nr:hypothetical protein [Bacteroides pyogenes]